MRQALETVRGQLGRSYPLVIGGKHISTDETLASYNPANKTQGCWIGCKRNSGTCA